MARPTFAYGESLQGAGLPIWLMGVVAAGLLVCNYFAGPELSVALLVSSVGALLLVLRPEIGVIILLSSLLVTYPSWAQGFGVLSLNNAIGALLLVVLAYRAFERRDWSFLRAPEVQLLAAIGVVGFIARYLNSYDDLTRSLVGELETRGQDPADIFFGRFAFLVFFVSFLRTRRHVYLAFGLTMFLLAASGVAGVVRVLGGGGFEGYRANFGIWVAAGGNPNRLALFCVMAIVGIRYLVQFKPSGLTYVVAATVVPLLVLAIFMTASRSGVGGLLLTTVYLFFEGGMSARKILVGVMAALVAAALIVQFVPEQSLERLTALPGTERESDTLGGGSIERRSYGAIVALDLAERNPLIGVGIGNWEIVRYLRDPARYLAPPHSSYLTALVEGGIVSLFLYLLLFARTLRNLFETEWALDNGVGDTSDKATMLWITRTLRVSFLVYLAFSLVGDLWRVIIFYWLIGLSVVVRSVVLGREPARAVT